MKGFKIDRLDLEILDIIEKDCSKTYAEIANAVNANLWTVRDRLNLLKNRGIIQGCKGIINHQLIGLPFKAIIQLNIEPSQLQGFISFMRGQKNVKNMMIITGSERILLTVLGASPNEIREFIQKQVSKFNVDIKDFNMILEEPIL
ncbi:MAG: Lrp/AsnC family transcriptional regulator [Thermoplasmatales archaeon]